MLFDPTHFDFESQDEENRYERLVGPQGHWRTRRDMQLTILSDVGLRPEQRVLDVGCGALRLGLPLIDYLDAGNYVGIDIDADCVAAANHLIERFRLRNRRPTIVQSTSFGLEELPPDEKFDIVWCFQVFIHLTEDLTLQALQAIKTFLHPAGAAYVSVSVREDAPTFSSYGAWRSYVLNHAPSSWYRIRADEVGFAVTDLGTLGPNGLRNDGPRHNRELRFLQLRPI